MWNPFKKKNKEIPICINCVYYSYDRFRLENHSCNRLKRNLKTINLVTGEETALPYRVLYCREERDKKGKNKCGYPGKFFEDGRKYK